MDSLGPSVDIDQKYEIWKYGHRGGNRYGLRIKLPTCHYPHLSCVRIHQWAVHRRAGLWGNGVRWDGLLTGGWGWTQTQQGEYRRIRPQK